MYNCVIQIRRDTAANWSANNPILAEGEIGYETDTYKIKIGDGVTAWNDLAYGIDTAKFNGYTAGNASGQVPVSNGTVCTNLNADKVDGYDATQTPTANYCSVAKADGFLDDGWHNESIRAYKYTWSVDVTIPAGKCLSIVLPPDKEITISDGYTLTIEDGGDLLIFSL